jgi:hypothetical protein
LRSARSATSRHPGRARALCAGDRRPAALVAHFSDRGQRAPPAHSRARGRRFGYFCACLTARRARLDARRVIKLEDLGGDPHRTSFGEGGGNQDHGEHHRRPEDAEGASRPRSAGHRRCVHAGSARASRRSSGSATRSFARSTPLVRSGYGTDGPPPTSALRPGGTSGRWQLNQVGYWSTGDNVEMSPLVRVIVVPDSAGDRRRLERARSLAVSSSTTSGSPARASSYGRR